MMEPPWGYPGYPGHPEPEPAAEFVHHPDRCAGQPCPFHNPSDHHMRDWGFYVREDGLTVRLCSHLVEHPDPDSARWMDRRFSHGPGTWARHGCDGCCRPT